MTTAIEFASTRVLKTPLRLIVGSGIIAILTLSSAAQTPTASNTGSEVKEEVVKLDTLIVTGTRRLDRTAPESISPIDIISEERMKLSVSPELTDKIMMDVPSFNVQRLPLSETTSFIRPARLRNLSSDHTLVLINGKRQHRTAGITSVGTQGVDFAQIPTSAIQRVEVLRDGASAQYGSDAIAGVINIILKQNTGYNGYVNYSRYDDDSHGALWQTGIDVGLPLTKNGFINIALEYTDGNRTSRAVQRPDALAFIAANPAKAQFVPNPAQRWGQPERETKRFMANSKLKLTPTITLYAFGLYGEDEGEDDFNWRNPATNGAFNRSAFQNGPNAIFPDFRLADLFPGGFTPLFSQETFDYSAVSGIKGALLDSAFTWDFSVNVGKNEIDYTLSNTFNPSFGALSPTRFDVGGLRQKERNFNADFAYSWENGWAAAPVTIAFGGEIRREEFTIRAGEPASFTRGPLIDLGVGSNGFAGWPDNQAGKFRRTSKAVYLDLDVPLTDRFEVSLAGRYEDFNDFGDTTDGKVGARFKITPTLAVRATASTGFHAPTPGLSNYSRTSSGPLPEPKSNSQTGLVSVNNPVAIFLGAEPLQPETSDSLSGGFVFTPSRAFSLSIDAYSTWVDDRLGESPTFTLTAAQRQQLADTGVVDALNINRLNFFTNAFDTRTQGVDVVTSYRWTFSNESHLTLTGAYNYNRTKVLRAKPGLINNQTETNIERRLPRSVGNLSAEYDVRQYSFTGRIRYFGTWVSADSPTLVQKFGTEVLFDLSATWRINQHLSWTVGAENLFNEYPDKALFNVGAGLVFSRFSPYDTDGARYFSRLNFSF